MIALSKNDLNKYYLINHKMWVINLNIMHWVMFLRQYAHNEVNQYHL